MKARPILFSAPMVQALLDGRKTQTRRVVKPQPIFTQSSSGPMWGHEQLGGFFAPHVFPACFKSLVPSPYGKVGDLLWVRESFKNVASGHVKDGYGEARYGVGYRVDGETSWRPYVTRIWDLTGQPDRGPMQFSPQPWKPSIHMPRWASRLTLEITGVRVERLQAISDDDKAAEGGTPEKPFGTVWRAINTTPGIRWEDNPWVWVLSFEVHRCNVDELLRARAA